MIDSDCLRYTYSQNRSDNVYSSVFLQSVSPNLYTVIKNTHKVLVGQLAGDGARIAVNGAVRAHTLSRTLTDSLALTHAYIYTTPELAQITGNVTVCLALSDSISVSSVYTVLDFASVYVAFRLAKSHSRASIATTI